MEDVLTMISRFKRPTLLVQTARHGLQNYNRIVHLRRLLKTEALPGPSQAIVRLIELEAVVESASGCQTGGILRCRAHRNDRGHDVLSADSQGNKRIA